jgi:hypothetical protein
MILKLKNYKIVCTLILITICFIFNGNSFVLAKIGEFAPENYKQNAKIVLIEKTAVSGRKIDLNINKIIQYKNLEISLINCWQSPKNKKDNIALILVEAYIDQRFGPLPTAKEKQYNKDLDLMQPNKILFYGWIFSKHKYINNIVHPIFDLWLESCY